MYTNLETALPISVYLDELCFVPDVGFAWLSCEHIANMKTNAVLLYVMLDINYIHNNNCGYYNTNFRSFSEIVSCIINEATRN